MGMPTIQEMQTKSVATLVTDASAELLAKLGMSQHRYFTMKADTGDEKKLHLVHTRAYRVYNFIAIAGGDVMQIK